MNQHSFFRPRLAVLAAAAVLSAAAPAVRAQSPSPEATEAKHDDSADIFDAIKKGADKLQKQAKDAGKIEPQLKQLEDRQAEYIKHQEEVERRLAGLLIQQSEEIHRLTAAVERLETDLKAAQPAAPAAAATPLPATEPAKTP